MRRVAGWLSKMGRGYGRWNLGKIPVVHKADIVNCLLRALLLKWDAAVPRGCKK